MTLPGPSLFIYYRVTQADEQAVATAARRMQALLVSSIPGLQAGLSRRPDLRDGLVTLMETYTHPDLARDAAIPARIEKAAASLGPWRKGKRYAERFDPI